MYDKPKVTIDLDEYNSLLDEKNRIVGDEYVNMAKIVIASLLNNRMDARRTSDELKAKGISFILNTGLSDMPISPDNIIIMKIKK